MSEDNLLVAWRRQLAALPPERLAPLDTGQALDLLDRARRAREHAHAPYSNFKVGAAIRCPDGAVFAGCNVENASYGATMCAERVAAFAAVSAGCRAFQAVAVVGDATGPVPPCGMCRQVLAEFTRTAPVIMANLKGDIEVRSLQDLLPLAFALSPNG